MFKRIAEHPDLTGVIIITVSSYFASFFSYLLQFFLGRYLSVSDYGEFNTFLAITYFLMIPSQVLVTSLIKFVSEKFGKNEIRKLAYLFPRLALITITPGVLFFFMLLVFKVWMVSYLKLSDSLPVLYFGVMIISTYLMVVPVAYLQGLLRYKAYAATNVVSALLRLVFPALAVMAGYGLNGVFGGIAVGGTLSSIFGTLLLKKNITSITQDDVVGDYKKIFMFSLPVLFVNFGMIMLNNIDIILIKRMFTPDEAGYYAGVVTLGKILLFGTSTISVVMYPKISSLFSQGVDYLKKLVFFLILQTGVVTAGTAVFYLFPGRITLAFFGERFSKSISYLPEFSIFIGLYVLVNFMVLFMLAVERTKVFLILLPFVYVQYQLINGVAKSIRDVIHVNVAVTTVLCLVLITYGMVILKNRKNVLLSPNLVT